jgi:hypothetical protein
MKYTHLKSNNAKAPILGSEAKERGRKDLQNCLRARGALENDLVRLKVGFWLYQADIFGYIKM